MLSKAKTTLNLFLSLAVFTAVPLPQVSDADGAFIRRTAIKKRATSGFRVNAVVGGDDKSDAGVVDAVQVSFLDTDGPVAVPSKLTLELQSVDPATGDRTFAANLDFEGGAVGEQKTMQLHLLSAGVSIYSNTTDAIIQSRSGPTIIMTVLNVPDAAGKVVVVAGDTVEVEYELTCEEPKDDAECAAQLSLSSKGDRIQLVGQEDGAVWSKKKRGSNLTGTINLRAGKSRVGSTGVVAFVGKSKWSVNQTLDTPVYVVASPVGAAHENRITALEASMAELGAALEAANKREAILKARLEAVEKLLSTQGKQVATNAAGVSATTQELLGASKQIAGLWSAVDGAAQEASDAKKGVAINRDAIIRGNEALVLKDQPTRWIFTHLPGFDMRSQAGLVTGSDGGPFEGYAHLEDVSLTSLGSADAPAIGITLYTSEPGMGFEGASFTLPNVDGLAPGVVTKLFSFDHDAAQFVQVGNATVSEDATSIHSGPGLGIVKGG